jgi:hypothetical protein
MACRAGVAPPAFEGALYPGCPNRNLEAPGWAYA